MAAGVDWLEPDDDRGAHPTDDPPARPRVPHRGRWALAAVGGAAVVAAAVLTWPDTSSTPAARPTASSASSTPSVVGAQSYLQSTVSQVVALAEHSGPVTDYVRQTSALGSCPLVRPGRSPAHDVAVAARAVLPGVTLVTIARTLDQFTGLCSLQLRGSVLPRRSVQSSGPPARAVVVVSVAAPPTHITVAATRVRTGEAVDGAVTTRYVSAELRTGWTVLIGARGDALRLPSVEQLRTLAGDSGLTWPP